MRRQKNYINEDGTSNINSSFLSCEKDTELIIKKLFVDSRPYSDELKRLMLINTPDCLDDRTNQAYKDKIANTSLGDMIKQGYIRTSPIVERGENEEVKSYIIISYDNFTPNSTNPHYRDCTVMIDVLSHIDNWELGNFRQRPLKTVGYIDGILNNTKLTGIGIFEFQGAVEVVMSGNISGYCLVYKAIHGEDDLIPSEE